MKLEHYFAFSAIMLFIVAVISLYSFATKKQFLSTAMLIFLEVLSILSVVLFILKFSIYKHICILTSLGLNLLNLAFIGLILSFIFSIVYKIRPLFSILSPIFLIIYIVGFVKSLNDIPHETSKYTILTYIHVILFTAGIIFNLLSLICFLLEKYFYVALRKKVWGDIISMPESVEKINTIGLICLIITMLMFGLGLFVGVYKVIEKSEFQFFMDPLPIGSTLSFLLLVFTYIFRMYEAKWLSYFNVTLVSNIVIVVSYIVHIAFGIGKHN